MAPRIDDPTEQMNFLKYVYDYFIIKNLLLTHPYTSVKKMKKKMILLSFYFYK